MILLYRSGRHSSFLVLQLGLETEKWMTLLRYSVRSYEQSWEESRPFDKSFLFVGLGALIPRSNIADATKLSGDSDSSDSATGCNMF